MQEHDNCVKINGKCVKMNEKGTMASAGAAILQTRNNMKVIMRLGGA